MKFDKDIQYYKFCLYGFLKNLTFFEPFLVLFFLEKQLSYLQIGTLFAVREIMTNVLEIPTGIFADSLGRRRTMVWSFISYIASFVFFTFTHSFALFIPAMILFSFGEAFRTGTHKAMIYEYLQIKGWKDQKVYYYGHTRSWSQVGSAVSSLIAGAIVFWSGSYTVIFLWSIVPYVLDMILMMTYPKSLDGKVEHLEPSMVGARFKEVIGDFWVSFRNPAMLRSIFNLSVFSGFYSSAKDFLQPMLKTLALSLPVLLWLEGDQRTSIIIAVTYFVIFILTAASSASAGKTAEKLKSLSLPLNISMIGGIVIGGVSGLLIAFNHPIPAVILYVGIYLIENQRRPIGLSHVSDKMNKDILATALSAESQAKTLTSAVLSLLIGFFADKFGLGYGLAVTCGILLLTVPLYLAREEK